MPRAFFGVVLVVIVVSVAFAIHQHDPLPSKEGEILDHTGRPGEAKAPQNRPPPACLESLKLDPFPLTPPEGPIPRFCGLDSDNPAPKHRYNEDYAWLGYGERQSELQRLHRNIAAYKKNLAGIVFDNSNHELVIVFFPPIEDGAKLRADIQSGLKELKVRVRRSCRSRAQMACAKEVLSREELWRTPGTVIDTLERKPNGDFQVAIQQDRASAQALKSLLGDMVKVKILDKIKRRSRRQDSDE